ncbi:MAG: hypothetical protein CMH28_05015 [Micavibrio sp.]|nr:hypothetical protein [Micavibrio sp.]
MQYLTAYITTAIIFLGIDFVWLGLVATNFYKNQLGDLMKDQPNLAVAAVFYLVYVIGLIIFAVAPALKEASWQHALFFGALFGLFAYATYDFTNLSTLRGWPVKVAVVDVIWGTTLSGIASLGGYLVTRNFMS